MGFGAVASASPYIVYSGSVTGSSFSPAGALKTSDTLYLLTDLSDTSSFAILDVDTANHVYTVISRPSGNPPAGEAADNFLGGIVASNGRSGQGVLSFSTSVTDGDGNMFVSHTYATGALTLRPTSLVNARNWPVVITLRSNGVATGTYTFPTAAAVSSGNVAFAKSLSGTVSNVEIGSSGPLAHVSTSGTFSLTEDVKLTSLANIGGSLTYGRNTLAIMPVTIPNGVTAADAYAAWLSAFAQANGYVLPSSSSPAVVATGATLSMGAELSSGAFTYSGSVDVNGAGTLKLDNGGTLAFAGSVFTSAQVNLMGGINISGSNTSGVLTIGSSVVAPLSGATYTIENYSGNSGAVLTVNSGSLSNAGGAAGGVTLVINNAGTTLGLGTIGLGTGSPILLGNNQTIGLTTATLTVASVNLDSTINGTLASINGLTINFSNATFVNNNTTSVVVPPVQAGEVIQGVLNLKGGTLTGAYPTMTDAGSTLTISGVTSATTP